MNTRFMLLTIMLIPAHGFAMFVPRKSVRPSSAGQQQVRSRYAPFVAAVSRKIWSFDSNPFILKVGKLHLNTSPTMRKVLEGQEEKIERLQERYKESNSYIKDLLLSGDEDGIGRRFKNSDPQEKALVLDQADSNGKTLLSKTLNIAYSGGARALLLAGAYAGAIDNEGNSVIMPEAIWRLSPYMLELALAKGVNPGKHDHSGCSALYYLSCADNNFFEDNNIYAARQVRVAQLLIEKAPVLLFDVNGRGETVAEVAAKRGRFDLVKAYFSTPDLHEQSRKDMIKKTINQLAHKFISEVDGEYS